MSDSSSRYRYPLLKTSLASIFIGLLLIGSVFTPIINPPQCTYDSTTQKFSEGNCITGANIGAGGILLLGMAIGSVGWILFTFSILRSLRIKKTSFLNSLFYITALSVGWIIVIALIVAPWR